jgi:hypothetical protein
MLLRLRRIVEEGAAITFPDASYEALYERGLVVRRLPPASEPGRLRKWTYTATEKGEMALMNDPVDCVGKRLAIGDRVTVRPPVGRCFEGEVVRHRKDPRGGGMGWLDVSTENGERSTRPSQCTRRAAHPNKPEARAERTTR